MINCIIVEDEALAAKRLKRILTSIEPDINIKKTLGSVSDVVEYLSSNELDLDLIFLDIHLSDGKSFEIFDHLQIAIPIIFTTAFDQYAIEAFKQNSVDYLLKPIQEEDLTASIEKYKKVFKSNEHISIDYAQLHDAINLGKKEYKKRFMVQIADKIRTVPVKEISLFYVENKTCFLITKQNKRYYVNYSLEKVSQLLDPAQFFRINRKVIAEIDTIVEVLHFSKSKFKVVVKSNIDFDIFVPAEKISDFKKWLNA